MGSKPQAPESKEENSNIIGGSLSEPERKTLYHGLREAALGANPRASARKRAIIIDATLPTPPTPHADASLTVAVNQKLKRPPTDPRTRTIQDLISIAGGPAKLLQQIQMQRCEMSLYEFVKAAWPHIDPAPFVDSWAVEALCRHLEAVTRGQIRFLLVNYPPRCSKTLVTSVLWPLWTWLQKPTVYTSGPQVRFLGASYGQDLSFKAAAKMRELVDTPWFQERWGSTIKIREGSDTKAAFTNTAGGDRQATSVTGRLLGLGGDIIVVDDPHNTEDVESEHQREGVLQGWREISTTRLNDPKRSALVVIMQRLNEGDVSGDILANATKREWVHLMIPMRHDLRRHCTTFLPLDPNRIFWEDPRTSDRELMWPERFDEKSVVDLESGLGPYMASGRLQQSPAPTGGGIIRREWWNIWPPDGEEAQWTFRIPGDPAPKTRYPDFDYILASCDTAYTEKDENDWSACTVWGIFEDKHARPRIMLISAWRARLQLNDLVTKIIATATRKNLACDAVLVENKATGHSVAQELKRLARQADFTIHLVDPRRDGGGDKVARMYAAQPTFASNLIYAPDTSWAEMVIAETEMFPKAKHDDLSDTVSQAINWMRKRGIARMNFEHDEDIRPQPWRGGNEGGIAGHYEI